MTVKVDKKAINKAIEKNIMGIVDILTTESIAAHIAGDLKANAMMGITDFSFDLISNEAKQYAKEYGTLLKKEGATIINGKKVAWLADREEATRKKIFEIIDTGVTEGKSMEELAEELKTTLIRDTKSEYSAIARTEVARIQSHASFNRYSINGIEEFEWLCGQSPCPICAQYCNKIFSIHKLPEIPVHPNCTCDKAPIIPKTWKEQYEIGNGSLSKWIIEKKK